MKKTLLALLSTTLLFSVVSPAQAEDQKVLAIIDTAINSTKFNSIIQEACFTTVKSKVASQNMSCPNGELFMEGKGAASAPWPASINNATYHGDSMVKAALAVNPNLKIVFVRYSDVTTAGNSLNSPDALIKAMEWVSNNAEKYSIDALSISQSSISVGNLSKCATEKTALNAVSSLNAKNIPTFAATGNDGSSTVIGFPSCVTGVTAIGAMGSAIELEKATNRGPGIDAVSVGKVTITKYNGVSVFDLAGSSGATVMAATSYITNNKYGTFSQYFNSLQKVVLAGIAYPYISR